MSAQTLVVGGHYQPERLRLVGWSVGDGSGTAGYNVFDYFRNGVYLGPDAHGIEPLVEWPTPPKLAALRTTEHP